jgi:hypothetical protein
MPYCKVLPIRSPKGLSGKLAYLVNARHCNHVDKTIDLAVFYGTPNAAAFLATTVAAVRNINARRGHGRKVKNHADEIIIRLPDLSHPTAEERALFFQSTVAEFCPDSPAVGVWHLDKYNGSADLHLIVANFVDAYPPKVRRTSAFNPITLVRTASDQITDILNERRHQQGVTPIVTMREVRRNRLKERGIKTLAEQLVPMLPFPAADLPEKIQSLGHKVTRYNASRNTISVCLGDGKKAHRFFIDRLLQEAVSLGVQLAVSPVPEVRPKMPPPAAPGFSIS